MIIVARYGELSLLINGSIEDTILIISKTIFTFSLLLAFVKISGAVLYYFLAASLGLDSPEVYNSYCGSERLPISTDFIHSFIINRTCIDSYVLYFIIFSVFQISVFFIFCYQFLRQYPEKLTLITFFALSPTIAFYSAGVTKDGFVLLFLMLAYIFRQNFKHLFILISISIRPFIAANYLGYFSGMSIRKKITFGIIILTIALPILFALIEFLGSIFDLYLNAVFIRYQVSISNVLNISSSPLGVIFILEASFALLALVYFRIGNAWIYLSLILLCIISLYNFNVLSRMVVIFIFSCVIFQTAANDKRKT